MATSKTKRSNKAQRMAELVNRMETPPTEPFVVPSTEFPPLEIVKEPVAPIEDNYEKSYPSDGREEVEPIEETPEAEEKQEEDGETKIINSVVAEKYKNRYIENATAHGVKHKAAKRSNWDWLAQQIASLCLNEKHALDMPTFVALLDANHVDHSKWTNRNKGWEGRFRMTGRVALQRKVVEQNQLVLPDGSTTVPTPDWVAKYSKES